MTTGNDRKPIVVVKVGTKVLADTGGHVVDPGNMQRVATQVVRILEETDRKIVLISSGAMLYGYQMYMPRGGHEPIKDGSMDHKRLLCGIGQPHLIHFWWYYIGGMGWSCAQILVDNQDFQREQYKLDLRRQVMDYLECDVVPIFNEDDIRTSAELGNGFSDNDMLALLVAETVGAERIVFLTAPFAGYYENNKLVKVLTGHEVCAEEPAIPLPGPIEGVVYHGKVPNPTSSLFDITRGGMQSKLARCHEAMASGIDVYIANGHQPNVLTDIVIEGKNPGSFGQGVNPV